MVKISIFLIYTFVREGERVGGGEGVEWKAQVFPFPKMVLFSTIQVDISLRNSLKYCGLSLSVMDEQMDGQLVSLVLIVWYTSLFREGSLKKNIFGAQGQVALPPPPTHLALP